MEPILLSQTLYDEIVAHAREGKPEEVCGILRGQDNEAQELVRGRNVAEDKINNYDVDPQTLLRQFEFEEAGDRMMGIYHSHPVSVAYPSATDAWSAHYPDVYYLICSLEYDEAPKIRGFRLVAHFPELDVAALRQALDFDEVRPGLFGCFQHRDQPVPEALQDLASEIPPPFYVVFNVDDNGQADEIRVVSVREYPIQVK